MHELYIIHNYITFLHRYISLSPPSSHSPPAPAFVVKHRIAALFYLGILLHSIYLAYDIGAWKFLKALLTPTTLPNSFHVTSNDHQCGVYAYGNC